MKDANTGGSSKDGVMKVRKKPGRVPTSCAECRRLKLRCDKNVPCEKCVSRGCASICPNGALTPGKNNRLFLATTEELHDRIEVLSTRIRVLENALRSLQETVSSEPHPLLKNESTAQPAQSHSSASSSTLSSAIAMTPPPIPSPMSDLQPMVAVPEEPVRVDSFGTLALRPQGETVFYGATARPEFLLHAAVPQRLPSGPVERMDPFFPEIPTVNHDFRQQVIDALPPAAEARYLSEVYQEYGKYLYVPLSRQAVHHLLEPIYQASQLNVLPACDTLGLLFIIFALGAYLDPARSTNLVDAQSYYRVSDTALRLDTRTTDHSVQAHIHSAEFLNLSNPTYGQAEAAWQQIHRAVTFGHSMGIHLLNGVGGWNLTDGNNNDFGRRRRHLFWQLYYMDTWSCFHYGRTSSLPVLELDNKFLNEDEYMSGVEQGEGPPSPHVWGWKYATLLRTIIDVAFTSTKSGVPYGVVLSCDAKVRDFPVPDEWLGACESGSGYRTESRLCDSCVRRWLAVSAKDITLLNLHRPYLILVLRQAPVEDLASHRQFPSVLAVYRSAWRLIEATRVMVRHAPDLFVRIPLPWSYALSAGIVMCLVVAKVPKFSLARSALNQLDRLGRLFEDAAAVGCQPAASLLGDVQRLRQKGYQAAAPDPPEVHVMSDCELERLAGKSCVITEEGASFDTVGPAAADPATPRAAPLSVLAGRQQGEGMHSSLAEDTRRFKLDGVLMPNDEFPFNVMLSEDDPREPAGFSTLHHHHHHHHHHHNLHHQLQHQQHQHQQDFGLRMGQGGGYVPSATAAALPPPPPPPGCGYTTYLQGAQHYPSSSTHAAAQAVPAPPMSLIQPPPPLTILDPSLHSFAEQLGFG